MFLSQEDLLVSQSAKKSCEKVQLRLEEILPRLTEGGLDRCALNCAYSTLCVALYDKREVNALHAYLWSRDVKVERIKYEHYDNMKAIANNIKLS